VKCVTWKQFTFLLHCVLCENNSDRCYRFEWYLEMHKVRSIIVDQNIKMSRSKVILIKYYNEDIFFCFGGGAYQHCSHAGLLYSNPNGVPSFISRGAPHQAA
jgi:hypothetical protein